jgi:Raf kinase inhibitor-like YbhB/YbcL family protein
MTLKLMSDAFAQNEKMPLRYTGDGEDVSPPLKWSGVPEHTRAFALICDDPDAPTPEPWIHWVIYGLDEKITELFESVPAGKTIDTPIKALQGRNTWGNAAYGGPAPPRGHGEHHYNFTLYALSNPVGLPGGATLAEFEKALKGNILATATLTGIYER